MDSSSISISDNATTSSSSFIITIIEYIAIFVIVYFFYSRGVLNNLLNSANLPHKLDVINLINNLHSGYFSFN